MFQTSIMCLIAEGIRSHTMSVLNERRRMVTLGYNYEEVCLNKGPLSILTYLEKRKLPLTAYIFCVFMCRVVLSHVLYWTHLFRIKGSQATVQVKVKEAHRAHRWKGTKVITSQIIRVTLKIPGQAMLMITLKKDQAQMVIVNYKFKG